MVKKRNISKFLTDQHSPIETKIQNNALSHTIDDVKI